MTYDPRHAAVVLFGGARPGGVLGDTWSWDGERWTQRFADLEQGPRPRVWGALGYERRSKRVVLLGGRKGVDKRAAHVAQHEVWSY